MIQYKQVVILYIGILLQINFTQTQWNGKFIDCGSYYVPFIQNSCSTLVTSCPVKYVPAQGPIPGNNRHVYSSAINQYPANGPYSSFAPYPTSVPYPQNVPFPPNGPYYPPGPYPPWFPNSPATVYGQGLDQAMALSSAYPNQPIIVINNGGNEDSGRNNGNERKNGGLFGGDGANIGDLAAIFLASKAAHKHENEGGPGSEPGQDVAYQPVGAGPVAASPFYSQGSSSATNNFNSNPGTANDRPSSGTVTHITIILPNSGATVSVEEKKEKKNGKSKNKAKVHKKKFTKKDEEEDSETDEDVNEEVVAVDTEESEDENVKGDNSDSDE